MTKKERAEALLGAFEAALAGGAPPLSTPTRTQSAPDDAFELFLLGLIVAAAGDQGLPVRWRTRGGASNPGALEFLRGPGEIYGHDGITHAVIGDADGGVEAHVGVMFDGRSGVGHEADVGLFDGYHAARCRAGSRRAPWYGVRGLLEAKLYARGPLALGHARSFVGLSREVGRRTPLILASNQDSSSGRSLLAWHLRNGALHGSLPDDGSVDAVADRLRGELGRTLRALTR